MNADNIPIAPPVPEPSTMPLLLSGVPILVGVSGGRDSIALLTLLAELPGCRPIACHVHHGIRKCTADADAKFTEAYARKLGIPFLVEYMDAPRVAHRDGLSLETAARKLRQECFALWHSRFPESMAALAHHRDDQAETAIFHETSPGHDAGFYLAGRHDRPAPSAGYIQTTNHKLAHPPQHPLAGR